MSLLKRIAVGLLCALASTACGSNDAAHSDTDGGASGGSGGSAGRDGGPGPDVGVGGGAEDARRDSPTAADAPRDVRTDGAAGCTLLAPAACSQCCIDQNWGDAGGDPDAFNLLFGDLCDTCRSTCTSKRPCGIPGEPSADGPCMACLQPKIQMRCDRGGPGNCSTPFLRCFLACPSRISTQPTS